MLIFSICTVKTYLPRKQLYYTSHVPGVREHDRHEVCAERLVSAALLFAQDVDLKTEFKSLIGLCSRTGLLNWCLWFEISPTWALIFWCGWMDPGLHITMPLLTSSLFRPRTRAPMLSPASARSRDWWNISIPERTSKKQKIRATVEFLCKAESYPSWMPKSDSLLKRFDLSYPVWSPMRNNDILQ